MATKPKNTVTSQPTASRKVELQPTDITQSIDKLQASAANIYADSLLQLSVGGFVSKAVVGSFSTTSASVASITVLNMPTRAMLDMAVNILNMFASQGLEDRLGQDHQALFAAIKQVRAAKKPAQTP
ncbi:hypothetical protein ABQJ54_03360 [Rhodanobacter sp. Si-c]|uniref:Uncharacterized protein n=1 Tax=Rhodanobacter lycopersici TaxID=3162487 RepID=A0ABV3QAL8_9GAMM